MANQFPILQDNPAPGTNVSVMDFPGFQLSQPPPAAMPEAQPTGFFDKLSQNPELLAAVLQFSGQALKPPGPGESPISVIGGALSNAAGTFTKANALKDERAVKREAIAEEKRQDTEVNPVEQSLIDYRKATGEAAKATANSKGMTTAQYKAMAKQQLVKDVMENYPGMTESQANLAVTMGEATDFTNFPSIAKAAASLEMAGNMSFTPADVQANLGGDTSVGGTGSTPFDPEAVKLISTTPAADMLKIDANPQAKQTILQRIGPERYYKKLAEAKAELGKTDE